MRVTFKVVLMGDGQVGKTTIRRRFMGEQFSGEYIKTIGANFTSQKVQIGDTLVKFQIWDLAGQPNYSQVQRSFYRGCKGAFLVFDLTRPETLDNLNRWIEMALDYAGGTINTYIIIGNKKDLDRRVDASAAEAFSKLIAEKTGKSASYYETSAATGENIETVFYELGTILLSELGPVPKAPKPPELPPLEKPPTPVQQVAPAIQPRLEEDLKLETIPAMEKALQEGSTGSSKTASSDESMDLSNIPPPEIPDIALEEAFDVLTVPMPDVDSSSDLGERLDTLERMFDKVQDNFSQMQNFFQSLEDVPKRLLKLETKMKQLSEIIVKLVQ